MNQRKYRYCSRIVDFVRIDYQFESETIKIDASKKVFKDVIPASSFALTPMAERNVLSCQ